jgi:heme/copper-type cytochrome/quinol oxidase subunit 3
MARDIVEATLDQVRDVRAPSRTHTQGPPPFYPAPPDDFGHGDGHGDDEGRPAPPLSNARLAMLMLLGTETMFFAGLIGSFLVFRLASQTWPPPTLPRLPVAVTGVNTLILLYSALTMWCAQRSIRYARRQRGVRWLMLTACLGATFLAIQGYEWVRLVRFGLTMASGVYGATFYMLIGCHGLHVLGAIVWLLGVLVRTVQGHYSPVHYTGLAVCGMYWYYVVALWPVLYGLVYVY